MKRLAMALAAALAFWGAAVAAPRPKQVGVVDWTSCYKSEASKERAAKAGLKSMEDRLKEIGVKAERVRPDIFLPGREAERDQYQRIVAPAGGEYYGRAIHEGMNDYVRGGGLLVTNVVMILEDADGDFVIGEKDNKTTDYPAKTFVGVHGHQSARMTRLKALAECPLTRRMKEGEWVDMKEPMAGRNARNQSAEVVILSDRQMPDRKPVDQPFLTFKHQGNGACIYFVGQVGDLKDPVARQVFRNVFSAETLEWLCLQE